MIKVLNFVSKINIWVLLLTVLFCSQILINLLWISQNNAPLPWDSANHLYISISIMEKIKHFDFDQILKTSNYYPILVHTISALILLFTGVSIKTGQALGTAYFILTLSIIFVYLKNLSNNMVAFFSVLFVSLTPIFFNQSRLLMLDIPSVGFLFLSLYFYQKSDYLKKLKFSLGFFAAAGLLAMTKWTGLIYLIVLAFFAINNFLRGKNKKIQIKNVLIGFLIFFVIALPWYLTNLKDVVYLGQIYSVDHSHPTGKNIWVLENFKDYLGIFIRDQVTPIPALVFLISLPIFIFIKQKNKFFVLLMIFVNYFLFSLLGNKDSRFTMHLVIFSSFIVSSVFYYAYKLNKFYGSMLFSLLSLFLVTYFLILSIRPASLENYKYPIGIPFLGRYNAIDLSNDLVKKTDANYWSMNELINDLSKLDFSSNKKIVVVAEWEHFNPSNIRTYTYNAGYKDLEIVTADIVLLKERYNANQFPSEDELQKFLKENNYLLIVEKNLGSPILLNGKALNQLMSYRDSLNKPFCRDFIGEISLPGQSCVVESGEILTTGSDAIISNQVLPEGVKEIKGYAEVSCPWGCSFGIMKQCDPESRVNLHFIKAYTLPNGEKVDLFKIN